MPVIKNSQIAWGQILLTFCHYFSIWHSVNLQDDEKKVVFQQSQDECVSVPSTLQEDSACNQPYSDGEFALDEEKVASAMDGACGCSHAEEDEIPTGLPGSLQCIC